MTYAELAEICAKTFNATGITSRASTQEQIDNYNRTSAVSTASTDACRLWIDNRDILLMPGQEVMINGDPYLYLRRTKFMSRRGTVINAAAGDIKPSEGGRSLTDSMISNMTCVFNAEHWTAEAQAELDRFLGMSNTSVPTGAFVVMTTVANQCNMPLGMPCVVRGDNPTPRAVTMIGHISGYAAKGQLRAATPEEARLFVSTTPIYKAA